MSYRGTPRGDRGGGFQSRGRGGFTPRGGRGGFTPSYGPPAEVYEMGTFVHATEGEMVCESINVKIPYFNAPIYLENKAFGKVDEILGPLNQVYFTIKPQEGIQATSFKKGDKFYIGGDKLLPLEKYAGSSRNRNPRQARPNLNELAEQDAEIVEVSGDEAGEAHPEAVEDSVDEVAAAEEEEASAVVVVASHEVEHAEVDVDSVEEAEEDIELRNSELEQFRRI
ncbi:Gar1-domain-containing protein [Polyplosphaeria fusca]|uniref:H/ACA ribonucleoprotein complex subunit n=1 Tax=Polyplosphaeria fusca TaxID=682080 RepID=A0A9P4R2R7_9PLEO|nr:Gar1-domain-containing protein [Polyplosphaeria fusca]